MPPAAQVVHRVDGQQNREVQLCLLFHLRLPLAEEQAKLDFTILLTVHTMNYLRSGRHKVAV